MVNEASAGGLLDTAFTFSRPLVDGHVDVRSLARVAARGPPPRPGGVRRLGSRARDGRPGRAVRVRGGLRRDRAPRQPRAAVVPPAVPGPGRVRDACPCRSRLASVRTRLETGAGFDVMRGLWGRVLRSRVALVRRFGAGDVTTRLAALEASRDVVDRSILAVLPAVLSGLVAGARAVHLRRRPRRARAGLRVVHDRGDHAAGVADRPGADRGSTRRRVPSTASCSRCWSRSPRSGSPAPSRARSWPGRPGSRRPSVAG